MDVQFQASLTSAAQMMGAMMPGTAGASPAFPDDSGSSARGSAWSGSSADVSYDVKAKLAHDEASGRSVVKFYTEDSGKELGQFPSEGAMSAAAVLHSLRDTGMLLDTYV